MELGSWFKGFTWGSEEGLRDMKNSSNLLSLLRTKELVFNEFDEATKPLSLGERPQCQVKSILNIIVYMKIKKVIIQIG